MQERKCWCPWKHGNSETNSPGFSKFAQKGLTVQKHENIFSTGHFYIAYCLWNFILLWPSVSVTATIPSFHSFDSEGRFSDFQSAFFFGNSSLYPWSLSDAWGREADQESRAGAPSRSSFPRTPPRSPVASWKEDSSMQTRSRRGTGSTVVQPLPPRHGRPQHGAGEH